jgi:signal transduction histidine kinase/CheY-like chemotaxis protein/CHASE3 domain sensor protein
MKLSIKSKLLAGFAIILVLLISMLFFMINKFSESNDRLQNIVEVYSKKINLSNELMIAVLNEARNEKDIILEKDFIQMGNYKDIIYKALETIDKKTIELQELSEGEGIIFLNEFKTTWAGYQPHLNKIIALTMKDENDEALAISIGNGLKVRDAAIGQLKRIIDKNEKSMRNAKIENNASYNSTLSLIIVLIIASILISIIISYWIIQNIIKRISMIAKEAERIASREFSNEKLEDNTNDELKPIFKSLVSVNESYREITENANKVASGDYTVNLTPRSEKDTLGNALNIMTRSLHETTEANKKHNWLAVGLNQFNESLKGDQSIEELASNAIGFLCNYLKANIGAVYQFDDKENALLLCGQYAYSSPIDAKVKFALNEGLIGQAAREQKQISLTDIPEEHIRITSSVLNAKPRNIIIVPFLFEGKTMGVLEIGRLTVFNETEKEFITIAMDNIGIRVNSARSRNRIQELLEETQVQSEELQSQQEELKQMNEELEEQTQNLKAQQEELQVTNEELEEQTQSLKQKNKEVEASRNDIEQKTKQLEISSKYKSEFLANMSHELRTPLNSLLILSKDLSENRKKNLDKIQVESAEIIYKSGTDLLILINEVLDLSKIEAGKMSINIESVSLKYFANDLILNFKHHAEQKGLELTCKLDAALPVTIPTDLQRLNQILKNLLSNAIKFTERGSVNITIDRDTETTLNISVRDTGIGIQEDKQMAIFEAFHQAEGGTSRKYGGTGLGLSISRELAKLLGAEIKLSSKLNEGSTFSLIIPLETFSPLELSELDNNVDTNFRIPGSEHDPKYLNYPCIADDRDKITIGDAILLIVEDDLQFASILAVQANKKGFKCLMAASGEDGLDLAARYKPNAIILDMGLPGINGQQVLTELKANPSVRHIPVHILSANDPSIEAIREGAIECLVKPIGKKDLDEALNRIESHICRKIKNVLLIEDSENSRKALRILIGRENVNCFEAETGKMALEIYHQNHIDCLILDLGLPDMSGIELINKLESIKGQVMAPIIVYTGKELTKEENAELQKHAEAIIIKGIKSEERLLDETALFLHRTITNLPKSKQLIVNNLQNKESVFNDKKILLVDDDSRNVFALSKILNERGMVIIKAENGKFALKALDTHSDIDLVLMDIMMPEMDGYETMRQIRSQKKFISLPVIALTAKAMNNDKQKCIDAGANDYIAKPIDVERLLSLMRVWMSK